MCIFMYVCGEIGEDRERIRRVRERERDIEMTLNPLWDLKGFFSLSLSLFQRDTDLLNIHP